MREPPALFRALMRALLPDHEITDALDGDLAEGFARRAAESPGHAAWWYRRRILTLPYVGLNREIGRLRAREETTTMGTGGGWMSGTTMDLRLAVRSLWKRPAFTGVATTTLALSIGAATLLYSVVDGVLMTPLPYEGPEELLTVYLTSDEWRDSENELLRASWDVQTMTLDHAQAFRASAGPLEAVSAYTYRQLPLRADAESDEAVTAILVDAHTFDVLGVRPALGRVPSTDEIATAAHVAVLRHETWRTRFGGDPDVLGRGFSLGDETFTVIGVMPAGFFFPTENGDDLWIPVPEEAREWASFYGIARLAPGYTTADATGFLERTARRMGETDAENAGYGARAVPHVESVVGSVRGGIRLLFGTALVVVLVACLNLANLFLVRAAGRREELAVRASLGAGTRSLVTGMLSEALVIGAVGGGLGIAIAAGAIDPFVRALGTSLRGLPRQGAIALDGGVLLFALGATLVTTLVAGLGPTLAAARRAPASSLGGTRGTVSSGGTRRSQRLLLGAQAALTVVLVSAAGLLGRSFLEAAAVDMGMDTDHVAVLEVETDAALDGPEGIAVRHERIRSRVAAIPGVFAVGLTTSMPSRGGVLLLKGRGDGAPADENRPMATVFASEGYFDALDIPILTGRGLSDGNGGSEVPGVVISESLALQLFGAVDAVGRHVLRGPEDDPRPLEVVGVVADVRQLSAFLEPEPTLYYPVRASQVDHVFVIAGVDGDPGAVLGTASEAVLSVDPTSEVVGAWTLARMLSDGIRHVRVRMVLMAALAALAAMLAVIGIAGVVAHYMSEQSRDVGIRMALGAMAGREVARVVRHALAPTVVGLAVGLAVAVASSRVMESFVFGIETTDPLTYGAVVVVLFVAAVAAAWLPARGAATVDPARVLNRE